MSNLFRKKSLERISSPEQLNAYIRVSTPSVWMLLAAIVILLVDVCVWGVFGHLDTRLSVAAIAQDGTVMNDGTRRLTPKEVLRMDWLCDNVTGEIPGFDQILPVSQAMVRELGIYRDQLLPEKERFICEDPDRIR